MKRINIQRDVESRAKIATAPKKKPTIKPLKPIESDAKGEEIQRAEADAPADTPKQAPPKRGRKTKGDVQAV